jgi:hypothetical protein
VSEVWAPERAGREILHGVRREAGSGHLRELSGRIDAGRKILQRVWSEGIRTGRR